MIDFIRKWWNGEDETVGELVDKPSGARVREWPDEAKETQEDILLLEIFERPDIADKLAKMSSLELVQAHKKLFDSWVRLGKNRGDELLVNANLLILDEILRRGSQAPKENELDELSKAWGVKRSFDEAVDKADYWRKAETAAKEISKMGPIILVPDYVSWSGSNMWLEKKDRKPNDIEIIIKDRRIPGADGTYLKLQRIARRFFGFEPHIVPNIQGPTWDHLPQWDLALIPKENPKIIELNEKGFADRFHEQIARSASPKLLAQAEQAKKDDRLTLGEFFYAMKPDYAVQTGEHQTVERFLTQFKTEDFPVFIEKKYDGNNAEVHKDGDKITIFSEDGTDITGRFPNNVAAFRALSPKSAVWLAEIELWVKGKHQPREATRGYIGGKDEPDDSNIVFNVYGMIYHNGEDLHKLSEIERRRHLEMVKFPQSTLGVPDPGLNLVPTHISKNVDDLKKSVLDLSHRPAAEGVVAKRGDATYYLDGDSRGRWLKFHKSVVFKGVILERIETAVKGTYNYRYGVAVGKESVKPDEMEGAGNEKIISLGKTFSTNLRGEKGDIIEIEAETFNFIDDRKTGTVSASAWAPRVLSMAVGRGKADTLQAVRARARRDGVLQEKTVNEKGETVYECHDSEYFGWDDTLDMAEYWGVSGEELDKVYEEVASKAVETSRRLGEVLNTEKFKDMQRIAEKKPKYHAIIERHFRGKSAHADFRVKVNGHLEGWTLTDAPEGAITEPVDTLEKGRRAVKTVKWKFSPDMKPETHVVAVKKSQQPLVWAVVNDKYLGQDAVLPPGSVGATRFDEGVLILEAEGMAYKGVEKPYFYEYFLDMPARFGMKSYKGRFIVRLIGAGDEWDKPPKGATQWQAKMAEDETPYLLTRRARTRGDYVPDGSALPPWWEEKIKPEFQWWAPGLSRDAKLRRMDLAYNNLIEQKVLTGLKIEVREESERKAVFALRRHFWRGQVVVRGMPVQHWDLKIDSGKKHLDSYGHMEQSPVDAPEGTAAIYRKWSARAPGGTLADWMKSPAIEIPPNRPELGNPNKEISAFSELTDSGGVEIIEENPVFISLRFNGSKLKGLWTLKREDPKMSMWVFSKSKQPGQAREEISLTDKDFPVNISFGEMTYTLIQTGQGKLRLGKK